MLKMFSFCWNQVELAVFHCISQQSNY